MKFRRTFSIMCLLIFVLSFAIGTVSAAASTVSRALPSNELLLSSINDVVNAYDEQYIIHSAEVTNKYIQSEDSSGYNVDFTLGLVVELDYNSAVQLPHVQGMMSCMGIQNSNLSTNELLELLQSDTINRSICQIAEERISASASASRNLIHLSTSDEVKVAEAVTNEVSEFIVELESLYIGQQNPINLLFRAEFDNNNRLLSVAPVAYDGSTYSIQKVGPATNTEMRANGIAQIESIVDFAVMQSQQDDSYLSTVSDDVVYHRVTARDYANSWTSNPTGGASKDTSKWRIRSNTNAEPPYYPANNNDCANYVSQAMFAGGIPKTSSAVNDKYHWFASEYGCSIAWESCTNMQFYFTENNYWTPSDFANCNAGGIIFLKDSSGNRYHVVMCVHNDTASRLYSAHTNDRLQVEYTGVESFGDKCASLEYWVFTNSAAD